MEALPEVLLIINRGNLHTLCTTVLLSHVWCLPHLVSKPSSTSPGVFRILSPIPAQRITWRFLSGSSRPCQMSHVGCHSRCCCTFVWSWDCRCYVDCGQAQSTSVWSWAWWYRQRCQNSQSGSSPKAAFPMLPDAARTVGCSPPRHWALPWDLSTLAGEIALSLYAPERVSQFVAPTTSFASPVFRSSTPVLRPSTSVLRTASPVLWYSFQDFS